MDLQRALITKLLDEDGLNRVKREGIDTTFLDDGDCKQVFSYIERHYTEYKKVPSRAAVKQVFPNFSFANYTEPLDFFIDQVKEGFRREAFESHLLQINRSYTSSTRDAEEQIRDLLKSLSVTQRSFKDLNLTESVEDRLQQYEERKGGGNRGIVTNWHKLDYQTLGAHGEEFWVLVGEKYIGKSWLMLWFAYQAMLQGERVLFATKEMSAEDLADRFDSILSRVSYDSLRRGELSNTEEQRYRDTLLNLKGSGSRGSITMARHSVRSVEDVATKAVEIDATIAFIDSVYLFDSSRSNGSNGGNETSRRMAISQGCKRIAQELGIPLVVSTQAGRRKTKKPEPGLDNIEWSNAFSQDADVVVEVIRDDIDKELSQAWLHLVKVRKGQETETCVKMDFNYMTFEEINVSKDPSYEPFATEEQESLWTQ